MYQQWFLWAFLALKWSASSNEPPITLVAKHYSHGLHADKVLETETRAKHENQQQQLAMTSVQLGVFGAFWTRKENGHLT
jgi:hypothetical protein